MKRNLYLIILIFGIWVNLSAQDAKMISFIDGLMGKMTLLEKLGQLNLSSGSHLFRMRLSVS